MVVINESLLQSAISEYTNYTYNGSGKIQLPYCWGDSGGIGKWTKNEIDSNLQTLGCDGKTTSQIQTIVNNNIEKSGIDCSGFALNTSYIASYGEMLTYYASLIPEFPTNLSDIEQLHWGISANNLTSLTYTDKITFPENMKVGDFIRFDNGTHIGIIKSIKRVIDYIGQTISYHITYAHSSGGKGPHEAIIYAGEGQELSSSSVLWSDWDSSYSIYIKSIFNYICRPKE